MAKLNSGTRVYGNTAIDTFLTVSGAVASTSTTTGTIIVTGGVGISGNVYANGIYSNDMLFNSGYGSVATAYGCRAWVNFNGTGTVAIRGSGNVSSITDNGTGNYTVNFTTALVDANYAAALSSPSYSTTNNSVRANVYGGVAVGEAGLKSTTQLKVSYADNSGTATFYDTTEMYVAIFR